MLGSWGALGAALQLLFRQDELSGGWEQSSNQVEADQPHHKAIQVGD